LTAEAVEMVAGMLRALGDPTRIRLIEVLNDRGGGTVSALTACVPVSQQRVSQQLAVLHEAGIVRRRREGMWVRYELVDWTGWWIVEQLASGLDADADSRSD
jgi:ArsR family transcriptional regulator, arsenate/arsenite/antimonite-responsive transcriptional repressor